MAIISFKQSYAGNEKGFSLVEILVALSILAIGLMGLLTMLPIAHERVKVADMEQKGLLLAEQGIERARSLSYGNLNDVNLPDEDYGTIPGYEDFSRQYSVTMASDSAGNPIRDVKMVTVNVLFHLKLSVSQEQMVDKSIALVDYIGESFKIR
jgi:prepilin-type N-terminal cleavage/methylation domain-containing protein